MTDKLVLAVPSKGRLMEATSEVFAKAGLVLQRTGAARGYRGEIVGVPAIEVAFVSASEIAQYLKDGSIHVGVTGQDLVHEQISDFATRVRPVKPLGFGFANVVVAVPRAWLDVRNMADLETVAAGFRRRHGRTCRVATKYINLTRRFFSDKGLTDYRIVESLGATEGTPAAGTADLIVDITTTGSTLKANGLKILDDGTILKSQATLYASNAAAWSQTTKAAVADLQDRLGG